LPYALETLKAVTPEEFGQIIRLAKCDAMGLRASVKDGKIVPEGIDPDSNALTRNAARTSLARILKIEEFVFSDDEEGIWAQVDRLSDEEAQAVLELLHESQKALSDGKENQA
jgi:hypothetical protein